MSDPDSDNSEVRATGRKRPYLSPRLQSWGTLRDITLAAGSAGGPDGAKKGSKKTS